jgi:hypothetical protein
MGIANIINNSTTTSGGEIVRELVNSSDGAGLNLQSTGNIAIANGAAQFGTSDFSIEFILNQEKENASEGYIYVTHVSGDDRLLIYHDVSDDRIVLDFRDGSTSVPKILAYDMNQDFGSPTHYVITFDRSGFATLYKNGNSVASVDISSLSSIDIGTDSSGGRIGTSGTDGVIGTFYRFRTFNKLVDAKALFENGASVDFSDQYASTLLTGNGTNFSTAQTSSNIIADPSTFNTNYDGNLKISNVAGGSASALISIASNVLTLTPNAAGVALAFESQNLKANRTYRLIFNCTSIGTGSTYKVQYQKTDTTYVDVHTVSTGVNTVEFTTVADTATGNILYLPLTTAGSDRSIVIDASSTLMDLKLLGCSADLDLSYANPLQSLTVQNRAGLPDGEASSSTAVTQVQPIIQGNLTSLKVGGGAAAAPADGQVLVDGGVVGAPAYSFTHTTNTGMWSRGGGKLDLSAGGVTRLYIEPSGDISFFEDTGASAKLRWDAADERLNLTGSDYQFSIKNGVNEAWYLRSESTGNFAIHRNTAGNILDIASTGLATFSNGINLGDTTLSNYAEGTWTPVLAISGGNDGGTLTQTAGALGKYVRVGKTVNVMGIINVTAASGLSGATTIVQISGFPFTADVNGTYNYQYRFNFSREDAITSRKAENFISFYSAATSGFIYDSGLGTGITGNELTTGKLIFSGTYITT